MIFNLSFLKNDNWYLKSRYCNIPSNFQMVNNLIILEIHGVKQLECVKYVMFWYIFWVKSPCPKLLEQSFYI